MRVRRGLAGVSAAGLLAVGMFGPTGCSANSPSTAGPAASTGPAAPTGSAASTGPAASTGSAASTGRATAGSTPQTLAFTGKTLDGRAFDGATLSGRPVVLWFWAPWCGTCAGQAASVSQVAQQYRDRLAVLGVAGLGDAAAMREFVTDTEVGGIPHLNDQAGVVWRKFAITRQSLYVLIDADGKVRHQGWLDSEQLSAKVAELAG